MYANFTNKRMLVFDVNIARKIWKQKWISHTHLWDVFLYENDFDWAGKCIYICMSVWRVETYVHTRKLSMGLATFEWTHYIFIKISSICPLCSLCIYPQNWKMKLVLKLRLRIIRPDSVEIVLFIQMLFSTLVLLNCWTCVSHPRQCQWCEYFSYFRVPYILRYMCVLPMFYSEIFFIICISSNKIYETMFLFIFLPSDFILHSARVVHFTFRIYYSFLIAFYDVQHHYDFATFKR